MRKRLVLSGLTLVALVLPAVAADAPEVEQARMVATQVLEETKSVLEGALKGGQPAAALGVCASVAQNIARRHEQRGWRVRRVSEKVRNSADAPDAEELTVLRAWQGAHAAGRLTPDTERQEIVTARGQRYVHYMKPIFIAAPACLQCHGAPDKLAPDVADALKLQGVPRCPRSGFPTLSHTPIAPAGLENEILSTTLVRDAGTRKGSALSPLEVSFLDISDRSCGIPGPVQRFASSHRVLRSLRSLPGAVRPAGPHRPLS